MTWGGAFVGQGISHCCFCRPLVILGTEIVICQNGGAQNANSCELHSECTRSDFLRKHRTPLCMSLSHNAWRFEQEVHACTTLLMECNLQCSTALATAAVYMRHDMQRRIPVNGTEWQELPLTPQRINLSRICPRLPSCSHSAPFEQMKLSFTISCALQLCFSHPLAMLLPYVLLLCAPKNRYGIGTRTYIKAAQAPNPQLWPSRHSRCERELVDRDRAPRVGASAPD